MAFEYDKNKYNPNLQSGRQNPNSNNFFGNISTGPEQIPRHIHNGVDSPKISSDNIVYGNVYTAFAAASAGDKVSNTLVLSNIKNARRIDFKGIAYTTPSITQKAILNGTAIIGSVFTFNTTGSFTTKNTDIPNISQANDCTFFDRTSVTGGYSWVPYVNADNVNLASVIDSSGNQIGYIQVVSYTNTTLTLQAPLNSGWIIEGAITIT